MSFSLKLTATGVLFLVLGACHRHVAALPPAVPAAQPPQSAQTPAPTPTPRRTRPPVQQTPQPAAPQKATPPMTLGPALTPEEQRINNTFIDQHLQHATQLLASLKGKHLTRRQQAFMSQVQSFIAQAQETRKMDLAGARSLAERADLLAADLAASVR